MSDICPEITIDKKLIYESKGKYIIVEKHNVSVGDIETVRNVVHHPLSASMLPYIVENGKTYVFLIKQFRKPLEKIIVEIPAGLCEEGESPQCTAMREVAEEIGYYTRHIVFVRKVNMAVGFCNAENHIFIGEAFKQTETNMDIDENIQVVKVELTEALKMIVEGYITDDRTLIALYHMAISENIKFF